MSTRYLHMIKQTNANWIGHILRRDCLVKHVIEEKIEEKRKRGIWPTQLLDDPKETRRYWKLKEEEPDRTVWRTRYGPVVRQIARLKSSLKYGLDTQSCWQGSYWRHLEKWKTHDFIGAWVMRHITVRWRYQCSANSNRHVLCILLLFRYRNYKTLWFESLQDRSLLSKTSRPGLWPKQPPMQRIS